MRALCVLCAAGGLGLASQAIADEVVFEYNAVYSGDGVPAGGAPYARATFSSTTAGQVTLHIEALLAPAEFISGLYFNFDPSMALTKLHMSHVGGTAPAAGGMGVGPADGYKAGGGGKYDIRLSFPTANSLSSPRFDGTDTATFLFTSEQAITAASFNFLSAPHGGHGPFATAGHIQGLGSNAGRSAWVSGEELNEQANVVPLPTGGWAGLASLAGVFGVGVYRRRLHRR